MSYRDGNDYPPQSSRVEKNAGKSRHFLCLDGRCLSSTSRLCAFPCSVHPALGKRCAPCLRASSASCLQSPATIYPHLQAASSICSSATLPSYSRRCEIGGSLHHPPRFSFSSPRQNHPGRNCWNDIYVGHFHICDTCQNLASGSPQLRLLPVALLQQSLWSGSRRINLPFPFPQWNNSSQEQATFVPKNRPAPPLSQVTNYICPEMEPMLLYERKLIHSGRFLLQKVNCDKKWHNQDRLHFVQYGPQLLLYPSNLNFCPATKFEIANFRIIP